MGNEWKCFITWKFLSIIIITVIIWKLLQNFFHWIYVCMENVDFLVKHIRHEKLNCEHRIVSLFMYIAAKS